MAKRKVSVRLEESTIRAYERADGNRSALMRRALREPIEDGSLEGVGQDLRTLAAIEQVIDGGRLDRRRGTFRKRCAQFFRDKWDSGYTSAEDAEVMAESWRNEGAIYGSGYLAWTEAVVGWYRENWDPLTRPDWPDAGTFYARAEPESVDVEDRLVEVLAEARESGLDRSVAVNRVKRYHPDGAVERAAEEAYRGGHD